MTDNTGTDKNIYHITKRAFDILTSTVMILLFSPFIIFICCLIYFDTGRPIYYLSERTGRNGIMFKIIKFRTMYFNADTEQKTTSKNDIRITPMGRHLRKYKLDELPQFFNVLLNDMSIVGPRPELPYYTDRYKGEETIILTVKPGITDYASIYFFQLNEEISDDSANHDYENHVLAKKNALRIKYAKECNFKTDVSILCKTVKCFF